MSHLIYSMMVSLDGFVARPNGDLDWVNVDEELHTFANDQARCSRAFLYGRRLYELMADYWPTADRNPATPPVELEFARIWTEKPKLVFSRTLDRVAWNARLLRDVLVDEIARLKAEPAGDLELGGPTLAATFIRRGLIDEYQAIVHPVVLGRGIPYFPPLETAIDLQLVETRTFASGVVYLRYRHAGEAQEHGP